jgi:hypothetical protein
MKTSRRDFLAVASAGPVAVASAWALRPGRSMASAGEAFARAYPLTVVFDEQLPDSRAFAMRARVLGARIVPMRSDTGSETGSETGSDIGALWFETLMPAMASTDGAIAGLTRYADAFLLTRFAMGAGMRLDLRASDERGGADALVAWRIGAKPRFHSCPGTSL